MMEIYKKRYAKELDKPVVVIAASYYLKQGEEKMSKLSIKKRKEEHLAQTRAKYKERRAAGLCVRCGEKAAIVGPVKMEKILSGRSIPPLRLTRMSRCPDCLEDAMVDSYLTSTRKKEGKGWKGYPARHTAVQKERKRKE